jgi:hypothetical protein
MLQESSRLASTNSLSVVMLVKLSCFLLQVNATHFISQCCAPPHKFYRILALRLDGAFGQLCDLCLFLPSPHCPHHDPSPNLHLLRFPMPDIPYISNMTFNAQVYWQPLMMIPFCPLSHSTYVPASKLF